VETGEWRSRASHVGGGIDSYYEYLLKCSLLFGDPECAGMWRESVRALNRRLAESTPSGFWYGQVDMTTGKRTASEFGALHAFLPAVLALGAISAGRGAFRTPLSGCGSSTRSSPKSSITAR
jgi:mannosidase alpha-like ER degradation enhancer 2